MMNKTVKDAIPFSCVIDINAAHNSYMVSNGDIYLDADVYVLEIVKEEEKAKLGKAAGIHLIPSEVVKNLLPV